MSTAIQGFVSYVGEKINDINKSNHEIRTSHLNGSSMINSSDVSNNNSADESSKFMDLIESAFRFFSSSVRIIGPFFFIALSIFILLVASCYFSVILPFYKFGILTEFLMYLIAIYLIIQIYFNYIMASIVKPGSVEDIVNSKYYSDNNPYVTNSINLMKVFLNQRKNRMNSNHSLYDEVVKMINNYSNRNFNSIDNAVNNSNIVKNIATNDIECPFKFCEHCKDLKPLRAHHCAICQSCIFKMDHHCPWINNCVGQNNQRFFILFLTWILIGCVFILITSLPIYMNLNKINMKAYSSRKISEFNFVVILCMAGSVILIFFTSWNWFLILKGNTTIEYWSPSYRPSKNKYTVINDFSMGWEDNFFMVFGTRNIIKAIFIPSTKPLPYSGLEWSKIVFEKVAFQGIKDFNSYNEIQTVEV